MNPAKSILSLVCLLPLALPARAQQTASSLDLGLLSHGAAVSFIQSAPGQTGIQIKGGDAPALSQTKPVRLEIYTSENDIHQLIAGYKSVDIQNQLAIARADITSGAATFHIEDRWSVQSPALTLHRAVQVSGNAPGGFYSAFLFTSAPNVGTVDYFIPAGTYRGRGGATFSAPASYIFREENPAAPMIGMYFKNGSSITMLNPAPVGDTTFEDVNPHRTSSVLIDDRLRFGIFNSTPTSSGGYDLGYWYPGSLPGPTAGEQSESDTAVTTVQGRGRGRGAANPATLLRRYNPIKNGLTQEYSLAFRIGSGETFPAFEKNTWHWAWDTLKPAVTPLDIDAARQALLDQLASTVTTIDGRTGIPWIFQATSGIVWHRPDDMRVAMGFVGKNIEAADQLLREGDRDPSPRGQHMRQLGLAIIDSFIHLVPMSPNPAGDGFDLPTGKPTVSFPKTSWRPAANNELFLRTISEDMVQLIRAYRREKSLGRDHPEWLKWAQDYVNWLLPQQRPDGAFPRSWQPGSATVANPSGTGSYNPVPLLLIMAQENPANGKKYLDAATRAAQYIWDHFGDKGYFQGGTLDQPDVIDKEAGMLSLEAFLSLYESTKDQVWLNRAQAAADYAETYIKIWNVPMPVDAIDGELDWKKGVPTTGLQGVSASGGAGGGGDEFMDWSTRSYALLYKYTHDKHYLDVARILLNDTKAMLALPGRTYDLAGPGWQQEHWGNRGFTDHRAWLPWVTTNHLWSITGTEEADPALFKELTARP